MFQWNNDKFAFNYLDADVMKHFDKEMNKLLTALDGYEKENAKNSKLDAVGIAAECVMFDAFFDGVFGAGTAKKMFAAPHDFTERLKAAKKLLALRDSQLGEHEKRVEDIRSLLTGSK